ncbi:DUF4199 domain-containing protein [Algoriphagus sp. AK58]|uniref:DUF4199 domain-containing protein n=1 Tax=Algoriphagus sp. AK58 TaxID=1406877 RepID=UPI00164F38F8|nr:DUF4199 domain-containing protein [Algoriphagus sp. AK58]MBC6366477.1 DUF4199 domain-containing protein [Algoriphagus sp. AK58]
MKNFQIEIKWGILFVLSGLIWMVLEKSLGWHDVKIEQHATYTLFYAPIAVLIYVFALRDKKRNFYSGKMNYIQGLISGLVVTFVVVIFTPLSQYISHEFISPDYFPNIIKLSVDKGMMSQEEAEGHFTLLNYIQQSLLFAGFMGLLTSAVVALFTRSKG